MKVRFTLLSLFVLFAVFTQAQTHVVVIGVDGMSPDGVIKAPTPTFDIMMENGAYTLHARGVLPTSSSPNWASMIMGAGPEQHGVTGNDWEIDDMHFPPVVVGDEGIFPTIFGLIRKNKPTANIAAIYDWDGFGRLMERGKCNYAEHMEGPYKTTSTAVDYIKKNKPDFLFIHLDHVDGAGHGAGHGSPDYYKAVALADSLSGVLVQAYKDAGIFDNTVFIVTSDHGGIGYGHGGESTQELEIPFLLYGKGIKKGYEIKEPVYTYDNAATVAYIFNAPTPAPWIGRPVKEAFINYTAPTVVDNSYKKLLPEPEFVSPAPKGEAPGWLYIDSIPFVTINVPKGLTVRYTMDGTEPNKNSLLYTAPFRVNQTTIIRAKSFDATGNESISVKAYYRVLTSKQLHPLTYKYYELPELEFLPDFDKLPVAKTGTTNEPGIYELPHRGVNFGVVIEGYIKVDKPGNYTFSTLSDDGSKMYVNGREVVNNDGNHGAKQKAGDIELTAGYHAIKVVYYNGGGGRTLNVFYKGPEIIKQYIPADVLYGKKP